jgi:hypothetical protein
MANLKSRHIVPGTVLFSSIADATFTEAAVLAKFVAGSIGNTTLKDGDIAQTKWDAAALARVADLFMDNQTPTAIAGKGVVLGVGAELLIEQPVAGLTVRTITGGTVYSHLGVRSLVGAGSTPVCTAGAVGGESVANIVVVNAAGALAVRAGASAVNPADPVLTAGDVPLARVTVANGVANILNAMIVDLRNRKAGYGLKTEPLRTFGRIANAAVRTLNAARVQVIAAPGVGRFIEIVSVHWWLDYTAPQFDSVAAGENLVLEYAGGVYASGVLLAAGWADAAADQHATVPGIDPFPYSTAPPTAPIEPETNAAVLAHVLAAEWFAAAGNSDLCYDIYYRVRTYEPVW